MMNWKVLMTKGVIYVALGVVAVFAPYMFTIAIEQIIGWLFIIGGVVMFARAIQREKRSDVFFAIILGLVYLIAGIFLLADPTAGIITLTILLTAFFIIEGLAKIFLAFSLRHYPAWGWFFIAGLVSLVLAAIVITGWPSSARWFLGLIVGINLLFLGATEIAMAIGLRRGGHL